MADESFGIFEANLPKQHHVVAPITDSHVSVQTVFQIDTKYYLHTNHVV